MKPEIASLSIFKKKEINSTNHATVSVHIYSKQFCFVASVSLEEYGKSASGRISKKQADNQLMLI